MRKLLLLFVLFLAARVLPAQCYSVSQITYAPDSFNVGTVANIQFDDHCTCMMDLPFPFCYFGSTYTRFMIGSNGDISFDSTYACGYDPWPISAAIPNSSNLHLNCIMFPWEDLDLQTDTASRICYNTYGTTPNRRFVVSFYHTPLYICDSLEFTGEVILYETSNNIEMHIQNKPLCPSWNGGCGIEGIQNFNGTDAATVPGRNYPTQWTAYNDAWRFSPNCCLMGMSALNPPNAIRVFPNPSSGKFTFIVQNSSVTAFSLTVVDVSGRVVWRDEMSSAYKRQISPGLPNGIYLLEMRGEKGEVLAIMKIIIA